MKWTVLTSAELDRIAEQQLADYDARSPGTVFADPEFTLSIDDAYQVQLRQAALREERGERIAGYKIGCMSEAIRAQLGLDQPVFGHLYAGEIRQSGVELEASQFDGLAIEGEFAFRIAEDIPDADWLLANPGRAIASCMAIIELHNSVLRASAAMRGPELVANNGIHAGVVVPAEEAKDLDPASLAEEPISVIRNGEILGSATGKSLPGGPLASLAWLVERLREFGKKVERGHLVLTGSPLPLYSVVPGDRIEVRSEHLRPVTVTVR